jgi:hypothetical protein
VNYLVLCETVKGVNVILLYNLSDDSTLLYVTFRHWYVACTVEYLLGFGSFVWLLSNKTARAGPDLDCASPQSSAKPRSVTSP